MVLEKERATQAEVRKEAARLKNPEEGAAGGRRRARLILPPVPTPSGSTRGALRVREQILGPDPASRPSDEIREERRAGDTGRAAVPPCRRLRRTHCVRPGRCRRLKCATPGDRGVCVQLRTPTGRTDTQGNRRTRCGWTGPMSA